MIRSVVIAAVAIVLLAGCSAQPAAQAFKTHYGESATTIANHIKSCKGVKTGDVGKGGSGGLASTASCTLDGRLIHVDSWASADEQASVLGTAQGGTEEIYYASGKGWTAVDGDDPTFQYQLTGEAGKLLAEAMNASQSTPDVDGEHTAVKAIAASLNGKAVHVTP